MSTDRVTSKTVSRTSPGAVDAKKPVPMGVQIAIAAVVGLGIVYLFIPGSTPVVDPTSDAALIAAAKDVVKNDTYRGNTFVVDTGDNHGAPTVKRYDAAHVSQVCIMVDEPTFYDHNWHFDDDGVARWCVAYLNPNGVSAPGQSGIESISRNGTELGSSDLKIQTWDMKKGYVQ